MNVTLPGIEDQETESHMTQGDNDPGPLFAELDAPLDRLLRHVHDTHYYSTPQEFRARCATLIDGDNDNEDDSGDDEATGTFREPFEPAHTEPAPLQLSDADLEQETRLEMSFSG